jgi:hypothetical protein
VNVTRLFFILANLPTLARIVKDFWAVITSNPDDKNKVFILELQKSMGEFKNAKSEDDKDAASRDLARLISKL